MDTHNTLTKEDEIELLMFDKERIEKRLVELGASLAEPRAACSAHSPRPLTGSGLTASPADAPAHTPGPWDASVDALGSFRVSSIRGGMMGAGIVVCARNEHPHAAEMAANARLIATAPELLEALKGLLRRLQYDADAKNWFALEQAEAHAAIAKATSNS